MNTHLDARREHAIDEAGRKLAGFGGNAAFLLHDRGAGEEEVIAYIQRWRLTTPEEAHKTLETGRTPMEKANSQDEVKKVLQQASLATRVGADPETDPCGASAVLRTKRYRLEAFGRQEAAESKKRKTDIRMPEEFIKKVMDMPNMEIEVQLCGDDEYFAEGALIELQQGSFGWTQVKKQGCEISDTP